MAIDKGKKNQKHQKQPSKPVSKPAVKSDNKFPVKTGFFILIFSFFLYANTINHDYTFDDVSVITLNKYTQEGFKGIPVLLTTSYWYGLTDKNESYYRPASLVTFAIEHQLAGDNPKVSHFMNILLFALTGLFLFICLRKLFVNESKNAVYGNLVALLTTLLFVAHPIHTEVVANVKSRDEILGFLFCILSLYQVLKYNQQQKKKQLITGMFYFLVAVLSKESALTFIAVFPLAFYLFRNFNFRKCFLATLPMILVVIVYFGMRAVFLDSMITGKEGSGVIDNSLVAASNIAEKYATVIFILGKYLTLLIFPHPLIYTYSYNQIPIVSWTNIQVILALIVYLAAGIYSVFYFIRKKSVGEIPKLIVFGILFYLITISLVSNLFLTIGVNMAERLVYTPSLGFCILLAILLISLSKAGENVNYIKNTKFILLSGIILLLFSIKTISRNSVWKNNETLFTSDLKNAGGSAFAHRSYANVLFENAKNEPIPGNKAKMMDEAIQESQNAIEIYPKYADAFQVLGEIYSYNLKYDSAVLAYRNVILYNPIYAPAFNNIGLVYEAKSNFDSAIYFYKLGVEVNEKYWNAWYNMGLAYGKKGNLDSAIVCFVKTAELNPGYTKSYSNLGTAYGMKGDEENAMKYFTLSLRYDPNDATTLMNLSLLNQRKGDMNMANEYRERAYRIDPSLRK